GVRRRRPRGGRDDGGSSGHGQRRGRNRGRKGGRGHRRSGRVEARTSRTLQRRPGKMTLRIIETAGAPEAIGPYSQGVIHGGLLFTAGQIAFDPATMEIVGETVAEQTERVFRNLEAVLLEAGSSFQQVLKATVFLRDMDEFAEMNEVFA